MKGLEVLPTLLIAEFQSSEVSKPTECALHDVAGLSQSAAVREVFPQRFQKGFDAQLFHQPSQRRASVSRVPLQALGLRPRSAARPWNRRHCNDHVQGDLIVSRVSGSRLDHQRQALGIGQHMAFAAFFPTIGRVGAGVRPPKTARTLALSMTARSRLTAPALPSAVSSSAWSFDHTARRVHAANRRQQVLPLPHPISVGRACQGIPVFRTNTIPASAGRCSTRGRPPLGDGGGSGGSNGSIRFHNSSDTSSAMRMPPCFTRKRDTTE